MIFGCGYVGTALAQALVSKGVRVGALTRNTARAKELRELGLSEVLTADLDEASWHGQLKGQYAAVVNCVSSAGGGIDGYRKSYLEGQRRIIEWAQSQDLGRFVYTSSTSVYPQDDGALVDETADTSAAPSTGQVLLESEALVPSNSSLLGSWYVLRLAGIYGPGRHFLLNQLRDGDGMIPGRGDYRMNMIHLDDIVSAILAALSGRGPSGVYNICDDGPETKEEVLAYLAEKLGLDKPEFDPENVSPRLRRRGGRMPDRIVSNLKAKNALNWSLLYPTYREGYASIFEPIMSQPSSGLSNSSHKNYSKFKKVL